MTSWSNGTKLVIGGPIEREDIIKMIPGHEQCAGLENLQIRIQKRLPARYWKSYRFIYDTLKSVESWICLSQKAKKDGELREARTTNAGSLKSRMIKQI